MLEEFSAHSKVWVYQSSRPFTNNEARKIKAELSLFAQQWSAHNNQLKAAGFVYEDRFIVLMADETRNTASGCSIDKSVRFIKEIESNFNLELFNRMLINYMDGNRLKTVSLDDLSHLFKAGEINNTTTVFNPLVQTKQEFDHLFKIPLEVSWLKSFV